MTTGNSNVKQEAQIRALIEERVKAVSEKNVDALLSNHAANVVSFDVLNPLQYEGSDLVRERARKWLSSYQSSIGYEIRGLSITADESVAFCHYLYRVSVQGQRNAARWRRS
jgi:ketosteroid isomerase-like protein